MMRRISVFEKWSQTQGIFVHHSQRRLHEVHYARCVVGGLEAAVGSMLRIGSMVQAAVIKMRLRSELQILRQQLASTGQGVRFVFRADRQIAEHRGRIGKEQPMVAAPKGYRQQ